MPGKSHRRLPRFLAAAGLLALGTSAGAIEPPAKPTLSSRVLSIVFPSNVSEEAPPESPLELPRVAKAKPVPSRGTVTAKAESLPREQRVAAAVSNSEPEAPESARPTSLRPARVGAAPGGPPGAASSPSRTARGKSKRALAPPVVVALPPRDAESEGPSPAAAFATSSRRNATAANTSASGLRPAAVKPVETPWGAPQSSATERSRELADRTEESEPEEVEALEPVTAEYEEEVEPVTVSGETAPSETENFAPIVDAADMPRPQAKPAAPAERKSVLPWQRTSLETKRPTNDSRESSQVTSYPSTETPQAFIATSPTAPAHSASRRTALAKLGLPRFEMPKMEGPVEGAKFELRRIAPPELIAPPQSLDAAQVSRTAGASAKPTALLTGYRSESIEQEKPAELLVRPAVMVGGD